MLQALGRHEEAVAKLSPRVAEQPGDRAGPRQSGQCTAGARIPPGSRGKLWKGAADQSRLCRGSEQSGRRAQGSRPTSRGHRSLRRAVEFRPDVATLHFNLGNVLSRMPAGSRKRSRSFRTALQLDPELADAHFNLGNALFASESLQDAAGSFVEALRVNPDSPTRHFNLGNALHSLGQYRGALASLPAGAA